MLDVGIIKILFLTLEELMILRKRQICNNVLRDHCQKQEQRYMQGAVWAERQFSAGVTHEEMPRHPGAERTK